MTPRWHPRIPACHSVPMEPIEALARVTSYLADERSDWEALDDDEDATEEERANHIWAAVEALNTDEVRAALEALSG